MQNTNDFAQTTANIPALYNHDVKLNEPFSVAVALQFIAERLSDTTITLVSTASAGYDDYMLLNIPAEHLDFFLGNSGFDNDPVLETFISLENDVYAVYTDFPELSANLDCPLDVDTFY